MLPVPLTDTWKMILFVLIVAASFLLIYYKKDWEKRPFLRLLYRIMWSNRFSLLIGCFLLAYGFWGLLFKDSLTENLFRMLIGLALTLMAIDNLSSERK